ncbi:hypothetical protein P154DRAFT_271848 [Amniculicola lignicola CBS 123094]|uniref:Uncharacterized protein n=1 Tax=Amniculicola lignicola CBS 123094 TaxID=1392246 RepID=A0A6A5WA54_9PLEO|nr:hypothetical protein P154DRAFT_271848 [Amniculicola lignicola CBS 123094]
MSTSWLQRKRKGELIELAQKANLPDADGLLKDDLVDALYAHLESNETTFGKQTTFADFYGRTGSPIKRERASPDALAVAKPRRRQTKVFENAEPEEPASATALTTRTPRAVSRVTSRISQVDIPASPAQLANAADQQIQVAKAKAVELWAKTRIDEAIEFLRENVSSVAAIQSALFIFEASILQWKTLATQTVDTPQYAKPYVNTFPIPDLTKLLMSEFWAPATLWSLTSLFFPLLVSYLFNLTQRTNTRHKTSSRVYAVDPLTFNIVKALFAYWTFAPTTEALTAEKKVAVWNSWGPFGAETVQTVATNVPGGYYGLQISAFIGIVISLYDAALKK